MHSEEGTVSGHVYLRLVMSRRRTGEDGGKPSTKVQLLSLGPLAKHDDGKPDYLGRLRESFRRGEPLIPELKPFVNSAPREKLSVTFTSGDESCFGEPKRLAACILDPIFAALGLDELFASIKFASKIRYDLQGIVRMLTYGRILEPASKMSTMGQSDDYFRPVVTSPNDDNVYDTLTVIHDNAQQIIRRMNTCITRGIGRNTSTVFYDVTNFFFEIPDPDPDAVDADGEIVRGLRKMGVSKENRKQPIVQVGLFMDDNGIPISLEAFAGNALDHHTLRPAMKRTVDTLGLSRYVLVADRGMYSGTNMCHVLDAGNGYIVSKSLRKSTAAEKKWATDPKGYTVRSKDFRHKSHIVTRKTTDEDGNERTLKEKVVVYWSRAFYERERHEHQSFLGFLERLKANPNGFRLTAAQSKSLRRFIKGDILDRKTGKMLDASKLVAQIDDEKLAQFNDLMGYYQIVTSELGMDDCAIIEKYHGLTQIEDQFREMKGTLDTRPVFVSTPEHIKAHLMVCFIALTMMRLIQRKTQKKIKPREGNRWSYGIPGTRLTKALNNWKVDELPGEYYRIQGMGNEDIRTILDAFNLDIKPKIYTKGDIRELKASVSAF